MIWTLGSEFEGLGFRVLEVRMKGLVLRRGVDAPWLPCVEGSGFTRTIQPPPVPRPWKERVTLHLDCLICAILARQLRMKAASACSFLVAREWEGETGTERKRVGAYFQNGRRVHPIFFENGFRMYGYPVPKVCVMSAVERIWHIKDSQGHITALAFRSKSLKP